MARSNLLAALLKPSFENHQDQVTEFEPEELSASADLAVHEVEMLKESTDAEAAMDALDELNDVVESLEALCVGIESLAVGGKLNRDAALFVQQYDRAMAGRLQLESLRSVSLEDNAPLATVSTEGIKETLKKLFTAQRDLLKRAAKALKDFFAKMFITLQKVQGWVSRYRKEIFALGDVQPVGKVKVNGGAELHLGGVFNQETFRQGLKNTVLLGQHFFGDYLDRSGEYYKLAASWFGDTPLKDLPEPDVKALISKFDEKLIDVYDVVMRVNTVEMSGGYRYFAQYGQQKNNMQTHLFEYEMFRRTLSNPAAAVAEFDLLSKEDLLDVLTDIETIASLALSKKDAFQRLLDNHNDAVEEAIKSIGIGDSQTVGTQYDREVFDFVLGKYAGNLARPIGQYADNVISALRASLDVVERCIKTYQKLPAPAAEPQSA